MITDYLEEILLLAILIILIISSGGPIALWLDFKDQIRGRK